MTDWTLYTREPDGTITAEIDDYQQFELVQRFNGVGTWQLTMHYDQPAARMLNQAGRGLYLTRNDVGAEMSGWVTAVDRQDDQEASRVVFSGVDDNIFLARRQAHPQPGTATPPYSTTVADVRTGTCSTVLIAYVNANLGPGALPARRVTTTGGLVMATDPVLGSTVTGRARWRNLLELLQELASVGGELGFRVRHTGLQLQFEVYQPTDKRALVHFSRDLDNLGAYNYQGEIPTVNYVYVGGGGEGTARTIIERQNPAAIVAHTRIETFIDRRDTTDTTELTQAGDEALTEGAAKISVEATPIDTEQQQAIADYALGDRVTAYIDDEPIEQLIRELRFSFTPEGRQRIAPVLSSPGRRHVLGLFERLEQTNRRLSNVERR